MFGGKLKVGEPRFEGIGVLCHNVIIFACIVHLG